MACSECVVKQRRECRWFDSGEWVGNQPTGKASAVWMWTAPLLFACEQPLQLLHIWLLHISQLLGSERLLTHFHVKLSIQIWRMKTETIVRQIISHNIMELTVIWPKLGMFICGERLMGWTTYVSLHKHSWPPNKNNASWQSQQQNYKTHYWPQYTEKSSF